MVRLQRPMPHSASTAFGGIGHLELDGVDVLHPLSRARIRLSAQNGTLSEVVTAGGSDVQMRVACVSVID